jgi:micrococcal nuclease
MSFFRSFAVILGAVVVVGCTRAAPPPTSASPPVPAGAARVAVVRVIDGDTIKVQRGPVLVTVRILGMDTPETHDPRKPVQCFGEAAATRAQQLLAGRHVALAGDPTQSRTDKYGRELDYVWLPDGTSYDWKMIRDGYAHEYTYRSPYEYRNDFLAAQAEARAADRGFWSPRTCDGNTTKAAQ